MSSRILYVGRQPDRFAASWRQLTANSAELVFAASQSRAFRELEQVAADVIVLDSASLPTPAGEICQALRQQAPRARIILVADVEEAVSYCYDERLSSPLHWRHLLKAIEEMLTSESREVIAIGSFVLDLKERTLVGPAGEGRLTPKQFSLLRLLMSHPNEYVPRRKIMREVWQTDFIEDTRTLDVHMSWLRRVVEPTPNQPRYLHTKRGAGYAFLPNGSSKVDHDKS